MSRSGSFDFASGTVLCVIRHGDAGDSLALPARDALRPLTAKGRRQAKRAGKALRHFGLLPRDVWTSRLVRAVETADGAVAAARLDAPPSRIETAALSPDAPPERIAALLAETPPHDAEADASRPARSSRRAKRPRRARSSGVVVRWLVGHEPGLSRLVGWLIASQPKGLDLKKGSVAIVHAERGEPDGGSCRLVALLPPSALKS